MPRYEYDVVQLKIEADERDRRCFKWRSRRGGCHDVSHDGLEEMLNRLGADGWHVVSHDTDSRWGSNLILERSVAEDAVPEPRARRQRAVEPPAVSAPDPGLLALAEEIRALRAQLTVQPAPQVTVQPAAVNFAAFGEQLQPLFDELKSVRVQQANPKLTTLSPEALDCLAATLERAVLQAVEVATQPRLVPAPPTEPKFETRRPWFRWSWVTGR